MSKGVNSIVHSMLHEIVTLLTNNNMLTIGHSSNQWFVVLISLTQIESESGSRGFPESFDFGTTENSALRFSS